MLCHEPFSQFLDLAESQTYSHETNPFGNDGSIAVILLGAIYLSREGLYVISSSASLSIEESVWCNLSLCYQTSGAESPNLDQKPFSLVGDWAPASDGKIALSTTGAIRAQADSLVFPRLWVRKVSYRPLDNASDPALDRASREIVNTAPIIVSPITTFSVVQVS